MAWKKIEGDKDFGKSWMFETDGALDGVYVESRKAKSKSGKPIVFHSFKVGEEEVSVLGGTILDRNIEGLEAGTRVQISFNGEKTSKAGNVYKDYSVSLWEE